MTGVEFTDLQLPHPPDRRTFLTVGPRTSSLKVKSTLPVNQRRES